MFSRSNYRAFPGKPFSSTPEVYLHVRPGIKRPNSSWTNSSHATTQNPDLLNAEVSPSTWAAEHLGQTIQLDPLQNQILDCPSKRIALLCSRQWGKSTVIAIKLLHFALHHPNAKIIIAANAESQSSGLLDKAKFYANHLQLRAASRKLVLTLPNGSEIKAIPNSPDTVRGLSGINLLIIDEAAFVPDQHFHAIVPFLATTNGHLWLLSTANNQRGFFYDIITSNGHAPLNGHAPHDNFSEPTSLRESGHAASHRDASTRGVDGGVASGRVGHADPGPHNESAKSHFQSGSRPLDPAGAPLRSYLFTTFLATAPDCPRITPEFLADERALKPTAQYEREYLCQFLPTQGQIFDAAILRTTSKTTQGPLAPTLLFGLDIGFQQSHTALAVLHLSWSHQGQDSVTLAPKYDAHLSLVQLERFPLATAHQEAWATIDRTIQRHTELVTRTGSQPTRILIFDYAGAGQVYFEHFKRNCKGTQIQPVTITGGQTPQAKSDYVTIPRQDLLNTLKVLLETNALQIPPGLNYLKELMDELKGINLTNTHRSHDDLAIALSLAAYRARVQMTQPPTGTPKGRIV